MKPGRLLGYPGEKLNFPELDITLTPGDTLWFFTDGFLEARSNQGLGMFGLERIRGFFRDGAETRSLAEATDAAKDIIDQFTGASELQDDLTLLALRRKPL